MQPQPGPSRLPVRSPPSNQNGFRSVSDPFHSLGSSHSAVNSGTSSSIPSFGGTGLPARRESLSTQSTLPSIRSLRSKFAGLGGGSKKMEKQKSLGAGLINTPKLDNSSGLLGRAQHSGQLQPLPNPIASRVPVPTMSPKPDGLRSPVPVTNRLSQSHGPFTATHQTRPSIADSFIDAYASSPQPSTASSLPSRSSQPPMFKKPSAKPFPGPPLPPSPNPKSPSYRASSPLPPGRSNSPLPPTPQERPTTPQRKLVNRISADFARSAASPTLASLRAAESASPNGRPMSIHRRAKSLHRMSTQSAVEPRSANPATETPVMQGTGWGHGTTPPLPSAEGVLQGLAPPRRKQRPVSVDSRPSSRGRSPEPPQTQPQPQQLRDDLAFRRHSIASPKLGGSPELERSPSGGVDPAGPPKRPSPVPNQPASDGKVTPSVSSLVIAGEVHSVVPTDSSLSVPKSLPSSISIPSTSSSGFDIVTMSTPKATAAAFDNFSAIPGPGVAVQPALTVTEPSRTPRHTSPGAPTERKRRPISIGASSGGSNRNSRYSFVNSPNPAAAGSLAQSAPIIAGPAPGQAPDLTVDTQLQQSGGRQRTQSEQSEWSATSSMGTPKAKPRSASHDTFGETVRDQSPADEAEDRDKKSDRRKTMRASMSAGSNYAQAIKAIIANDENDPLTGSGSEFSLNQISQGSPLDELVDDLGGRPPSSTSETPSTVPTSHDIPPSDPATSASLAAASTTPVKVTIPTVALTPALSVEDSPTNTEAERTLTLEQMEREIARMEAELALSGTPRASIRAFGFDPLSAGFGAGADDSFELPLPSPSSIENRRMSQSSLAMSANSRTDNITPRTARKWSMVEVEMAYERMKDMLGSTKSLKIETSGGESDGGDIEGAFERAINRSSPSPMPRSATPAQESGLAIGEEVKETAAPDSPLRPTSILEAEDDVLSLLEPDALTSQPNTPTKSPKRITGFDRTARHSTGTTQPLRLPTVSIEGPTGTRNHSIASSADSLDPGGSYEPDLGSSPATSPPNSAVVLQTKASAESLAVPARTSRARKRHTLGSLPTEDVFSPEKQAEAPVTTSSRARRGSDSERVNSGPSSARLVRSRTLDSGRSISALSDTGTDDSGWATPHTTTSKDRKGSRSPGQRSSSRLSLTAPLRSGAGKEMQKWATDGEASDIGAPPSAFGSVAEARLAAAQAAKEKADAFAEERKAKRQSKEPGAKPLSVNMPDALTPTTDSWFPITPGRAPHRRQSTRTNTTTTSGGFSSSQPDSPHADVGNNTFASDMSHATLNMASVRSMDKLEIFFKYTATKAELDKAALERDALLDALAESRATLADVRRQRDDYEKQASAKRSVSEPHLSSKEDRARWEDLKTLKETWEERAKAAIREAEKARAEVDSLRRELQDGKAREEQLERETVMSGARLAAAEAAEAGRPTPSPRIHSDEFPQKVGLPRSRKLMSPNPGLDGGRGPTRIGRRSSAPNSPVQGGMSRSHSQNTVVAPRSPAPASPAPSSPAAQIASAFRQREAEAEAAAAERSRKVSGVLMASTGTTDSATSLSSSTALDLQLDSSPLLQQSPTFDLKYRDGAKASWGSTNSPLKARSGAGAGPIARASPSQFARIRLPQPGSPTKQLDNRLSTCSLASADGSEFGDHLPPKEERGWSGKGSTGPGGLRAADEAFLGDLQMSEGEDA